MQDYENVKRRITNKLNLPEEILLDTPIVRITSNCEVVVENHKGINEYTNTSVNIKSTIGFIIIKGCSLGIKEIDQYTIVVDGVINSLEYK